MSFVVYGGDEPTDIDLANLHTRGFGINGASTGDRSGLSVAGTGDVNKDGKADLLIGAPNADYAGRVDAGTSYLLLSTPPVFTAPGAPTGVTGTPGDAQVQLSWTAPSSDGGAPISGYQIETATGGGPWTITTTTAGTTTTLTGLTNGTSYQFRIAAINPAGVGPVSEPSGTLIPKPASTPATLNVTARAARKAVPKTGKVRLVRKVTVGPGQTAAIAVRVAPKKTKKKVTVTKTATTVKVRTKKAPKGKVTVRITSSGAGHTPVTWTRTWRVR